MDTPEAFSNFSLTLPTYYVLGTTVHTDFLTTMRIRPSGVILRSELEELGRVLLAKLCLRLCLRCLGSLRFENDPQIGWGTLLSSGHIIGYCG